MIIRLLVFFTVIAPNTLFGQSTEKEAYKLGMEGVQKVDAGEYQLGIQLLKKARNLNPGEYDYTLEIGKAYLESGAPKKAERFLFDLQYHVHVQPDLYLLLAKCYSELNELHKNPDPQRKREMKALQYGIARLPNAGILYLELGQLRLELDQRTHALAIWEKGIEKAPNFQENYFWAAKMMKAGGNDLWTWVYSELFFNMTDDEELKRSAALLATASSTAIFQNKWKSDHGELDQELRILMATKCEETNDTGLTLQMEKRNCLLENFSYGTSEVAPLFERMQELKDRGWLEAYTADLLQQVDKEQFLKWLAGNAQTYDAFAKWSYWNRMSLTDAITRQ